MKVATTVALLALSAPAWADFSYKITRKTGGMMAAMAPQGPAASTNYYKGQKMKADNGATATILDFDARTITTLDNNAKTYTVRNFGDVAQAAPETQIEVKETGQKKTVNGYNATEFVMTIQVDMPQARQMGPMQAEVHLWAARDVEGVGQLREFYKRNAGNFPWAAMAGSNGSMRQAMTDLQRKMAEIDGIPVETVIQMKPPGGGAAMPQAPQMSGAQSAQIAQARARLEAMVAQGGPGAAMAKQALDRMPGGSGAAPPAAGGTSNAMIEVTMDASDFSAAAIPDSIFAIPAGYTKSN